MRELHTIEVDKWVPGDRPGTVKHAGMISPQEVFDALKKHLTEVGLIPDEYFHSNEYEWKGVKELPDYIRASCDVNWGGSEGIYLDIDLLYRDENEQLQRFHLATGKTLGRTGDDYLQMSRIAAECSLMLNSRGAVVRFNDEPQKDGVAVELNNQMVVRVYQKDNDIYSELVDTDGEVLQSAKIDGQDMFEFLRSELYKDEKEHENIQLTACEKSLVAKALDVMGDKVADTIGYSSGEEYWDLKAKFVANKNTLANQINEANNSRDAQAPKCSQNDNIER